MSAVNGFCAVCGREGMVEPQQRRSFAGRWQQVMVCIGKCEDAHKRDWPETRKALGVGSKCFGRRRGAS